MMDTNIFDKKQQKRDRVLLILQLLLYLTYVGLTFATSGDLMALKISRLALITISFLIKLYREYTTRMSWRQIIDIQLGFYVIYLLTGFECLFQYKVIKWIDSIPIQAMALSTVIISNINYSLFTNQKSLTVIQFIVYSIGMTIQMCLNIKTAILSIDLFFGVNGGAYLQTFILLTVSTRITIGMKILQKIYVSYKTLFKGVQQRKEKKSIEIELAETLNSRN